MLSARRMGLEKAQSELIMNLDSDDEVTENAVELLMGTWESIPKEKRGQYCGVLCPCRDSQTGKVYGDMFPKNINQCSHKKYLNIIARGERFGVLRRSMMLEEYTEFETVKRQAAAKFVPEGTLHIKYEMRNRYYCINEPLRIYHTEDSNSLCRSPLSMEKCRQSYFCHTYVLRNFCPDHRIPFARYFSHAMYAVKFAMLTGCGMVNLYQDVGNMINRLVLTLALPFGICNFILGQKIK